MKPGIILQRSVAIALVAGTLGLAAIFTQPAQNERRIRDNNDQPIFRTDVITLRDGTFGYNILADGALLIHQPHVPAVQGVRGFPSEEVARSVAEVVMEKLRRNEIPSVSIDELRALGVQD